MDGSLKDFPHEDGVALVANEIRRTRADVVLSFGPEGGGSGHLDHKACWQWTHHAFNKAADPEFKADHPPYTPLKLYWTTWPPPADRIRGIPGTISTCIVDIGQDIDALKREAFHCHRTQLDFIERHDNLLVAMEKKEWFHLAKSKLPLPDGLETNLLEGVPER